MQIGVAWNACVPYFLRILIWIISYNSVSGVLPEKAISTRNHVLVMQPANLHRMVESSCTEENCKLSTSISNFITCPIIRLAWYGKLCHHHRQELLLYIGTLTCPHHTLVEKTLSQVLIGKRTNEYILYKLWVANCDSLRNAQLLLPSTWKA